MNESTTITIDNIVNLIEGIAKAEYQRGYVAGLEEKRLTDKHWGKEKERTLEQEPCEDAISRQAVLESIKNLYPDMPVVDIMGSRRKWLDKYAPYFECENAIERSPSVNPQEPKMGHCKECKWWKDKDGVYRRGIGAESSCPFNTKEIYDGDAYCYRFEPQESEGQDADSD